MAGVRLSSRQPAPMAATVVAFGFPARACPGFPCTPSTSSMGALDAGLYTALGAGALVGSFAAVVVVRKVARPPGSLRFRLLHPAVVPCSCPRGPWSGRSSWRPSPAVNGRSSRYSPRGHRKTAAVMTAVISVNTIAALLGFLWPASARELPFLFTAVVAGSRAWRSCLRDRLAAERHDPLVEPAAI
jgi:hypothetical protein